MEKFYSSKTLLKLAGGGMHPPWIRHCLFAKAFFTAKELATDKVLSYQST